MSARLARWSLAVVPLLVAALVAAVMFWAGERRMVQISAALPLVVLGAGVLLTLIAIAYLIRRTITARTERQVATAVGHAEQSAALRERENHRRFLARLDHELKNPITAIRATVVAAGEDTPHWRTVDAQATKLGTLVRDLRKLAELETRELEIEKVDLEALVAEAVAALAQQNPDAGERISLTVTRVPWPVPPVDADPDLLALAIDNVLANAAKFAPSGPIEVRIREQEGSAVVEIADSGRGIPAEDLPQIFDELARAQNARDVPGSGLGLTLVTTVMRRHGGDVRVGSLPTAGTVVTLRLPLSS